MPGGAGPVGAEPELLLLSSLRSGRSLDGPLGLKRLSARGKKVVKKMITSLEERVDCHRLVKQEVA